MNNTMKRSTKNQLLLLEDVDDLGRSGDVVKVKPGYARNFLLPKRKGVVADPYTLRLQEKLREERAKQAVVDKADAEQMAEKINTLVLTCEVKVDPDGHMYGSVSAFDIIRLLEQEGFKIEKRNVVLAQSIKELGEHKITLKLKEGVPASFQLQIVSELGTLEAPPESTPEEKPEGS